MENTQQPTKEEPKDQPRQVRVQRVAENLFEAELEKVGGRGGPRRIHVRHR